MQKFNDFVFKTYSIIIAKFSIQNKISKFQFFGKTFFRANIDINLVLKMLFVIFSNTNIQLNTKSFT